MLTCPPLHEILPIPIAMIDVPEGGRTVGDVSALAGSIRSEGQLQPILVRRRSSGRFYLIFGRHRLAAMRSLGMTHIVAVVAESLNKLHAEMAMIDENLMRCELTVLERAEQSRRRKEIYEALNPEAPRKAGRPKHNSEMISELSEGPSVKHGGAPDRGEKTMAEAATVSFAEDQAKKTGVSSRTVRHEVQIAEKLDPEVKEQIRDTPTANVKTDLLQLARQTPTVQKAAVQKMTAAPEKKMTVTEAVREARKEQRAAVAAAAPAPTSESLPARIEIGVADAEKRWPMEDAEVDIIVTSPPYGIDVPYRVGDVDADQWCSFMRNWLDEAFRVTKPTGRLCVNIPLDTNKGGWRPTYAQTVDAALSAGWLYRNTIVWNEGNVSRSVARGSVDSHAAVNVTCPVEMIAVFYKEDGDGEGEGWKRTDGATADIPHEDWLAWTNGLWTFNGESRAHEDHPAAFPEELPRRLILLFSGRGATVCDPFNGSGTTTLVAHKLGRKAIGFDKDPAYVASAKRRLAAAVEEAMAFVEICEAQR